MTISSSTKICFSVCWKVTCSSLGRCSVATAAAAGYLLHCWACSPAGCMCAAEATAGVAKRVWAYKTDITCRKPRSAHKAVTYDWLPSTAGICALPLANRSCNIILSEYLHSSCWQLLSCTSGVGLREGTEVRWSKQTVLMSERYAQQL